MSRQSKQLKSINRPKRTVCGPTQGVGGITRVPVDEDRSKRRASEEEEEKLGRWKIQNVQLKVPIGPLPSKPWPASSFFLARSLALFPSFRRKQRRSGEKDGRAEPWLSACQGISPRRHPTSDYTTHSRIPNWQLHSNKFGVNVDNNYRQDALIIPPFPPSGPSFGNRTNERTDGRMDRRVRRGWSKTSKDIPRAPIFHPDR